MPDLSLGFPAPTGKVERSVGATGGRKAPPLPRFRVGRGVEMGHHSRTEPVCIASRRTRDENNRRKASQVLLITSACLLAGGAFEFVVAEVARSAALFSDALHNLGDVFTTLGLYVGFRVSGKAPNARYPYGYGRAEDLAGIGVVFAIWLSAVLAGLESLE